MDKDKKVMYDAWIDDILDDVRNNVVGEFWQPYFDTPFHKKVLKHLIQQSKFDNDSPVMGDRYDLYFKYNNYYRLENNSETHDYLHNYLGVEDKDINNILTLYNIILKHIVETQGYEDNMLTESEDKQKEYLDKVVDRLLKESEYRLWEDGTFNMEDGTFTIQVRETHLKKIRVDIKFGLANTWREDPIEYFDMQMVLRNIDNRRKRKYEYLEDYEKDQLTNIYGLNSDEMEEVTEKYYREFYSNIYNSYLEMDEDDKVPTSKPEKWMRGDEVFEIGGRLDESYSEPKLEKIVNHFFNRIDFDDDEELVSIKDFTSQHGINTFLEYSSFCTWETLETYIPGKIMWVLEHIYGLNKREQLEAGYSINNLIRKKLKNCELKNRYNFNNYMSDEDYVKAIDNNTNKHLNESLSSDVNKDVDKLFKNDSTLKGEENIKNKFKKLFGMDDWVADHAMVLYLSKQQSLNESDRQDRVLDKIIRQLVKETIIYPSEGMISLPSYPDEKWNARRMFDRKDYFYNRLLTHTVNHCRDVYRLTNKEINYVWNKYFDQIHTNYYSLKKLNESTEKPKGMDLKYLFKVADSIIKEIEIDDYPMGKSRGYGPWNDNSTGHYRFWVGLEEHAKDIYGLTDAETETVSNLIWDSLNSKNFYLSDYNHADEKTRKHFATLREQHYPDWDERSREQNINLLKAKGIDILSTDTNVPFFKRIDSKEIRFLKKVTDILDKESRIESVGDLSDGDSILLTPFGKFEFFDFMKEYRHSRFEKYVNDIYGVGDNQIMFPTHNSIAQTRESDFLWGMFIEKLKIKQLRTIYPDLDIPDNATITEQDLSNDDHKSLLKSFEVMDTPEEIATEELGNMIKWVKTLPEELFLYRVLYLDDVNDINYDELGSHYSQDRTDLINNHYDRGSIYGDMGEHAYLITVKVPKSEVDVMETLNNNILYPHEKEITLKDEGRGATYLDLEKI